MILVRVGARRAKGLAGVCPIRQRGVNSRRLTRSLQRCI